MKSNRPGTTLVEVLLSMVPGSMIMLLAMGVVNQSMKHSKRANFDRQYASTLARLSPRLRMDIRSAQTASLEDLSVLKLTYPSGTTVTYRQSNQTLVRESSTSDLTNETRHEREDYLLGDHHLVTFDPIAENEIRCRFEFVDADLDCRRLDLEIQSRVGGQFSYLNTVVTSLPESKEVSQ